MKRVRALTILTIMIIAALTQAVDAQILDDWAIMNNIAKKMAPGTNGAVHSYGINIEEGGVVVTNIIGLNGQKIFDPNIPLEDLKKVSNFLNKGYSPIKAFIKANLSGYFKDFWVSFSYQAIPLLEELLKSLRIKRYRLEDIGDYYTIYVWIGKTSRVTHVTDDKWRKIEQLVARGEGIQEAFKKAGLKRVIDDIKACAAEEAARVEGQEGK